jgi:AraC-like DNA-binding protein
VPLAGRKIMRLGHRTLSCGGELLALPANSEISVDNLPSVDGCFLSIAVNFDQETLKDFIKLSSGRLDLTNMQPIVHSKVPMTLYHSLSQYVLWSFQCNHDEETIRFRKLELLWILGQDKLVGSLLMAHNGSWKQRLSSIFAVDLTRKWKLSVVSDYLGVSETTLRRHSQEEQTSFTNILEHNRLLTSFNLLNQTTWHISEVATSVGYASHSRFSERFKSYFGMTPKQLRDTDRNETVFG